MHKNHNVIFFMLNRLNHVGLVFCAFKLRSLSMEIIFGQIIIIKILYIYKQTFF